MQTYGKMADFYKISNTSEKSQILHDDYLDHEYCSKNFSVAIATEKQQK